MKLLTEEIASAIARVLQPREQQGDPTVHVKFCCPSSNLTWSPDPTMNGMTSCSRRLRTPTQTTRYAQEHYRERLCD
jgi:hypothetical protein